MSSFQGLGVFPEEEAKRSYAHAALYDKAEREHARNSFGLLPQGS